MTERTGFKYSVGFNSCGSALFIALKTCGVQPGDHVLANGFSFTAVPSAIHHAGGIPVYVESTDAYVMDMEVRLHPSRPTRPRPALFAPPVLHVSPALLAAAC